MQSKSHAWEAAIADVRKEFEQKFRELKKELV